MKSALFGQAHSLAECCSQAEVGVAKDFGIAVEHFWPKPVNFL